jgi:hypothetical protein
MVGAESGAPERRLAALSHAATATWESAMLVGIVEPGPAAISREGA